MIVGYPYQFFLLTVSLQKRRPLPVERSVVWGHDEVLKNILRNPTVYNYDLARIEVRRFLESSSYQLIN